jgi:hypothetical protein
MDATKDKLILAQNSKITEWPQRQNGRVANLTKHYRQHLQWKENVKKYPKLEYVLTSKCTKPCSKKSCFPAKSRHSREKHTHIPFKESP